MSDILDKLKWRVDVLKGQNMMPDLCHDIEQAINTIEQQRTELRAPSVADIASRVVNEYHNKYIIPALEFDPKGEAVKAAQAAKEYYEQQRVKGGEQ